MYEYVTKKDFETLADLRVEEGKALLDKGLYVGAYYLLGYAVECALKACVCKHIKRYHFPKLSFIEDSYTHSLTDLLKLAGDKAKKFANRMKKDRDLRRYWNIVIDWDETDRYRLDIEDKLAKDFYWAINDPGHGVLKWIKKCW